MTYRFDVPPSSQDEHEIIIQFIMFYYGNDAIVKKHRSKMFPVKHLDAQDIRK